MARKAPHRVYLAANVPLIAAYFALPKYHLWIWGTLGLGASIAVVIGTIINGPRRRWPWLCVALALFAFVSGDTSYNVLTQFFHELNPFPSLADGFYLLTYPLFAAGLLGMVRSRRRERDLGPLLDALVVTAGCALVSWMYLIEPYVHAHELTLLQRVISIAYPLGDILILAVLARLLSGGGIRNRSVALLTSGAVGLLAADCVYGWIQLNSNWKVGGPTDIGWVIFYCFWGAAALHPSMTALTEVQPARQQQLSRLALFVLTVVTLVAPLLIVWRIAPQHNTQDVTVAAMTSAVVFLLVMARLTGLARSQAMHAQREKALRSIGDRLVSASELEDVFAAAVEGVQQIVPGLETCLVTEIADGFDTVVAARPSALTGFTVEVSATNETVSGRAGLSSATAWKILPLVGRIPRRLLIGSARALPTDVAAVIEAVGAQVSVGAERVQLASDLHRRRSEQRFRSLVQNAADVILVVEASGHLRSETPSLSSVLGYAPETLEDLRLDELLHPDDASQAIALIETMFGHHRSSPIRTHWRVRHVDGRWLDMEVIGNDLSDDPFVGGIALTLRDVTDRKALEAELRHQAFHDSLTGLPNRALFADRVDHALSQRLRSQTAVSVLVMDLDDFKLVNDTLGHAAGDDLLVEVGRRLQGCMRPGDTVARLGGDEFAVCATFDLGTDEELGLLAGRVLDAFAEPCEVADTQLQVRMSIGMSVAHDDSRDTIDMLREADLALYAAKNAGKGTFRVFEAGLRQEVLSRLERRAALEEGINQGDLRLLYQPIVRLADGEIVGLEALVRWEHATLGLISPVDFIDIAEESGLIVQLGRWVLDRAYADLRRWQQRHQAIYVSVNVSPRQLQSPHFLATVDAVIEAQHVDPSRLTFEITESALVNDSAEVLDCLHELHARGVTLSLDDFGTGYSSLSYLRRFPMQILKIDRSFVENMFSTDGMALVDAIVSMAGSLDLGLVAEGIETAAQIRELQRLGCTNGQGYLFSKPVAVDVIDDLFARGACIYPHSASADEPDDRHPILVRGESG